MSVLQDGVDSPGAKLIGMKLVTLKTGWGAKAWNDGEWGELKDAIALPTGLSITSSVGSVDVPDQIITPTSFEITSSQGEAFIPVMVEGISATSLSVSIICSRSLQVRIDRSICNKFCALDL